MLQIDNNASTSCHPYTYSQQGSVPYGCPCWQPMSLQPQGPGKKTFVQNRKNIELF